MKLFPTFLLLFLSTIITPSDQMIIDVNQPKMDSQYYDGEDDFRLDERGMHWINESDPVLVFGCNAQGDVIQPGENDKFPSVLSAYFCDGNQALAPDYGLGDESKLIRRQFLRSDIDAFLQDKGVICTNRETRCFFITKQEGVDRILRYFVMINQQLIAIDARTYDTFFSYNKEVEFIRPDSHSNEKDMDEESIEKRIREIHDEIADVESKLKEKTTVALEKYKDVIEERRLQILKKASGDTQLLHGPGQTQTKIQPKNYENEIENRQQQILIFEKIISDAGSIQDPEERERITEYYTEAIEQLQQQIQNLQKMIS